MKWQLQEAKSKFSEVVERALKKGEQPVTVRNKEAVTVIATEELRQLREKQQSLVEFFENSPLATVDLSITRTKEPGRSFEL